MRDLDELRRRLWLAVLMGAVGCEAPATDADASPNAAAPEADEHEPEPEDEPKPKTEGSPHGGMMALVDKARADVAANALAQEKLAAEKKAAFAAATCSEVVDRAVAVKEAGTYATLEHGCPLNTTTRRRLEVGPTATLRDSGDEDNCCYAMYRPPVRGRPYDVDGVARLPDFAVGRPRGEGATLAATRRRAAAGWLHDAREELASVPAFERAALELAQVGAPPELIDACVVAAAEEQHHADLCLAIAEALAGRALFLGPAPAVEARPLPLLALLLDTFEAGCVGETIAAAVAARSALGASPAIVPTLERIATDETDHAALAWRILAWGLPRLTPAERAGFFRAATGGRVPSPPSSSASAQSAVLGRMPPAAQAQVAADVWTRVIDPLLREVAHPTVRIAEHV